MRYFLLVPVLFLQISFSQNYYPVKAGNQWFYDSTKHSVVAVKDSLFPNGRTYSVLNRPDYLSGKFIRVDSQYIYYFDSSKSREQRIFKLDGVVGDTTQFLFYYYDISRIERIDTVEVFGETTRIITYSCDGLAVAEFTFSDKFGLIRVDDYGDPPSTLPMFVSTLKGCVIDGKKYGFTLSVKERLDIRSDVILFDNYPNPFNPTTTIEFSLSTADYVTLSIVDCLGREVATLISDNLNSGRHTAHWDAHHFSSGVYFYRLTAPGVNIVRKMLLEK